MDKELLHKRIKVLNEIELLKNKCDCDKYNIDCPNCVAISNLGKHLLILSNKREDDVKPKPINTENLERDGIERLESIMTLDKYLELKKENLTEIEVAQIFLVSVKALKLFRQKHGIKVKRVKNRTPKEMKRIEKIIKREEKKIAKKVSI